MVFRKPKKQSVFATFAVVMDYYSRQNLEITVGGALAKLAGEYYTDAVQDAFYSGNEFGIDEALRLSMTNSKVDSLIDKINTMPRDFKDMKALRYVQILKSMRSQNRTQAIDF